MSDFGTITGLVILNSSWWFDWCLYDCKFRYQIAKVTIAIKLHDIFLLLSYVNVIQLINVFAISYFQYKSSYLINLWFSDTMLNKLQNIVFPGSTFWFQEEICAILLLIRTCSAYGLNWQARQLLTYLTVVLVNKWRLWIIAAVSWDCVCVHSARLNYNKTIGINSCTLSK